MDKFDPSAKLYLLAHANDRLPVFMGNKQRYTPAQVADLLIADKLNKEHRDIELLVCSAGESLNTLKGHKVVMKYVNKYDLATQQCDEKKQKKVLDEYNKVSELLPPHSFFEQNPQNLLLPLAAQFCQALKDRGFTNFRVIGYKCPVSMYSEGGKVHLDLREKGGPEFPVAIDPRSEYEVIWR